MNKKIEHDDFFDTMVKGRDIDRRYKEDLDTRLDDRYIISSRERKYHEDVIHSESDDNEPLEDFA